jgi:hypothetical protein
MLDTVDFDDDLLQEASKIDDIARDRRLAAEMIALVRAALA